MLLSNTVRAIKSYILRVNGNILLIFHPIKQLLSVFSVYFLHVNIELCPVFTKGASRVTDNEEILQFYTEANSTVLFRSLKNNFFSQSILFYSQSILFLVQISPKYLYPLQPHTQNQRSGEN